MYSGDRNDWGEKFFVIFFLDLIEIIYYFILFLDEY